MKKIYLSNIAVVLLIGCVLNLESQTIWNGTPMTFSKSNYTDWNLPENQDRITDDIWITRGNTMPIFNIAEEDHDLWGSSPTDTKWAFGKIADGVENLLFDSWGHAIGWAPPEMVGQDMVLFLVTDGIYIDIKFTSWTSGKDTGGGGFSYERSTGTPSETLWTGDLITFSKPNNADWTLQENQDRITDNVWITRADEEGIFNIAQEEWFFSGSFGTIGEGSPRGTEWAFGKIADGVENLTFDYWGSAIGWWPPEMVGKDMVVHLLTVNIYIDIKFTSWTSGQENGGGGFSYERATGNLSETFWTGNMITFSKTDSVDWTLPENQDRITDNVWITRAHQRGIFNIAWEEEFVDEYISSPTKTKWAFGSTGDGIENLEFDYFLETIEFSPPGILNTDMVLLLEPYDIYIDIKFTSWTSGNQEGGGGFSYTRSTKPATSNNYRSMTKGTLRCYPNPASTYVSIEGAEHSPLLSFHLFDIQGRKVLSRMLDGKEQISIEHLTSGLYLYAITEDDITHHGRMVIE